MLNFFPTPYPDELLYSILARYHFRSGNSSCKTTMRQLFNVETVTAVVDMPSHINQLCNRLPEKSIYNAQVLISQHTLLPYYAPFLPPNRIQAIISDMKGESGGVIHMRAGIMASRIKTPLYLRYCPICAREDMQHYGEMYWHRLHQVPGVLVCPSHQTYLKDSTARATMSQNKHIFHLPHHNVSDFLSVYADPEQESHLFFIAQNSMWLLMHNIKPFPGEFLTKFYTAQLKEKNMATPTGRIRMKDFLKSFLYSYGDTLLQKLESSFLPHDEDTWLHKIVRKPRVTCHPLRHLLVLRYFGKEIKDLVKGKLPTVVYPFGEGPWPCLNAASDHYRKLLVNKCEITICSDTRRPIGTFTCICGFVYSRRGPDICNEDKYKIGRIKDFGSVWIERLRELSKSTMSLRAIARELSVDVNTIKKYLITLENRNRGREENLSFDEDILQNTFECKRNKYRYEWLELQNKYPNHNRTALRRSSPATYSWLYRNDRTWLFENLPQRAPYSGCSRKLTVDWEKRDNDLSVLIKQAAKDILNSSRKPIRVTKSRVGKNVGCLAVLEQHLERLPECKKTLEQLTETKEEFKVRRIKFAANRLREQGVKIKKWRLIREAGIRPYHSMLVENTMESLVDFYNE